MVSTKHDDETRGRDLGLTGDTYKKLKLKRKSINRSGEKCGAKCRQSESLCARPAGWGTDHVGWGNCRAHGGNAPANRKHAHDLRVSAEMEVLDAESINDPLSELSRLAGQIVAWKDAMGQRVQELTELRFTDAKSSEQLRSEVALFERGMDRCTQVLVAMAKLDIDARLARISERQTEVVVAAMIATLVELNMTSEQQTEARGVLVRHLRALP